MCVYIRILLLVTIKIFIGSGHLIYKKKKSWLFGISKKKNVFILLFANNKFSYTTRFFSTNSMILVCMYLCYDFNVYELNTRN